MLHQAAHRPGQLAKGGAQLFTAGKMRQRSRFRIGWGLVVGGHVGHITKAHLGFGHGMGVGLAGRVGVEILPQRIRRRFVGVQRMLCRRQRDGRAVVPGFGSLDARNLLADQGQQCLQLVFHPAHGAQADLLIGDAAVRVGQYRGRGVGVQFGAAGLQVVQLGVLVCLLFQFPVDDLHVVGQIVDVCRVVALGQPFRQPQLIVLAFSHRSFPRFRIISPFNPPPV